MSDHLTPTVTDRGFKWMPATKGLHGEDVQVYESSNAAGPHLWLKVRVEGFAAIVQLDVDAAGQLAEQLRFLIDNHYQAR